MLLALALLLASEDVLCGVEERRLYVLVHLVQHVVAAREGLDVAHGLVVDAQHLSFVLGVAHHLEAVADHLGVGEHLLERVADLGVALHGLLHLGVVGELGGEQRAQLLGVGGEKVLHHRVVQELLQCLGRRHLAAERVEATGAEWVGARSTGTRNGARNTGTSSGTSSGSGVGWRAVSECMSRMQNIGVCTSHAYLHRTWRRG